MDEDILYAAIEELNKLEMLKCSVSNTEKIVEIQALLQNKTQRWTYHIEVKTKIVPAQIPAIKKQVTDSTPLLVIAEYITAQAKKILQSNHIPYLDTAGNIFLIGEGLYIYVETPKTNRKKLKVGNRAFNKTGLKVVYELLIHPKSLNESYRYIGDAAKVSIDTVRRVIQELLREKYIVKVRPKEYQFLDRSKLFQEWVTAFNRNLRPLLKQQRYRLLNKNIDWKKLQLPDNTYWGGEIAAEIVDDYLIANKGILYTGLPFRDIMKEWKLIPDDKGELTIFEKFWNENSRSQDKTVNYMLLYADLMNEFNPRYSEAAEKIYEIYLGEIF